MSKKFQQKYTPLFLTTIFIITTICVQTLLVPIEFGVNLKWWKGLSIISLGSLVYIGLLGTGFYYLVYQQAIKKATPVVASMTLYLQPIFSFIWAFFLLGERLTLGFIIGSLFAFVGAGIVSNIGVGIVSKN